MYVSLLYLLLNFIVLCDLSSLVKNVRIDGDLVVVLTKV